MGRVFGVVANTLEGRYYVGGITKGFAGIWIGVKSWEVTGRYFDANTVALFEEIASRP